jgi:hypothetical protein
MDVVGNSMVPIMDFHLLQYKCILHEELCEPDFKAVEALQLKL